MATIAPPIRCVNTGRISAIRPLSKAYSSLINVPGHSATLITAKVEVVVVVVALAVALS